MRYLPLCLALILLTANRCRKEPCHPDIILENNSDQTVFFACLVELENGSCFYYSGNVQLVSGESFEFRPYHTCIEDNIGNEKFVICVLKEDIKLPNSMADCDTLQDIPSLIEKIELDLEDLIANDFRVVYP